MNWLQKIFKAQKFIDRKDAAIQMANILSVYRDKNPLILAIPRGAVPIGEILANELNGELDIVLARKIGAPQHPEYAIGAIDESGNAHMTEQAHLLEPISAYIENEKKKQLVICQKYRQQYTPSRAAINPKNRTVIIVDDGLATGATMIAALKFVRAKKPANLICAVPVGHQESLKQIENFADAVHCVLTPPKFQAVSQFYHNFSQIDDSEVEKILSASDKKILDGNN